MFIQEVGAMRLVVSNRSSVPLYEQIKGQVKDAVLAGELSPDDLLPSVRQLARDLRISVITTTRAYRDLEAEGLVVGVQGKGYYVVEQDAQLLRENTLRRIEDGLGRAIEAARAGGVSQAELIEMLEVLYREDAP
ncbi:MAG: GntR family transcriptional regulator [Bifidobacteriaceae bacterium]|nr:GntR family transcriptional regulator [Bifidobacteriaceae bacterium]